MAPQSQADVLVVGAGHNGLVAACYLARAGLDVQVVEARDIIGGCTTSEALVDGAPEHMLDPCADDIISMRGSTVVADLDLAKYGYREVEVTPPYVALDADGGSIAFFRDPNRTAEDIRRFSPKDARTFLALIEQLMPACDTAMSLMATNPVRPEVRKVLGAARVLRRPRGIGILASLATASAAQAIQERFEHPTVRLGLAQLASYGSPITKENTGVNLMIVPLIMRCGMARPIGGMGLLPASLQRCLSAAGGRIRTGARVEECLVEGGRVRGVRLIDGEELRASTVLAATEPTRVLNQFLPPGTLPDHLAARAAHIPTRHDGCAHFRVALALRGRLTLKRHSAARADDVDLRVPTHMVGSLDDVARGISDAGNGRLPSPLPFSGIINSGADPSVAPDGQDVLSLWSGWVPLEPAEDWTSLKARAEKEFIAHAMDYYDGIEELEIGRWVESPPEMTERTNVPNGNVYHVDMTLARMGPLRPALGFGGYRMPVRGLYLSGAGAHPGPSVSGLPGQQAARALLSDLKRDRNRS
ncbi:MAG TPA: NAD(P)/FAD-dependent oxidoreductase [Pseudonocardia sp.]|jgi:phytoene dehydrogenase-like protein